MLDFPSLCLTLAFTIAVVTLTDHRVTGSALPQVFKIFHSTRSTAHANVAGVRWRRGHNAPQSCQCDLWCRPLGLLGRGWGRYTHGDHVIALREVILAHPVRQVRFLTLLPFGGYFA